MMKNETKIHPAKKQTLIKRLFTKTGIILFILAPVTSIATNQFESINPVTTSQTIHLSPGEQAWLSKQQSLRYVYDPDWAPFEWKNEIGNHTGIIHDILGLIKSKSGLNLTPVSTHTWDESVQLVKDQKADMFSAITQSKERRTYLNFTKRDIYSYPAVLITKFKDKTVYIDIEKDFQNKRIGIVKSSGLGRYIKDNYPRLNYIEIPSTQEGFKHLRKNKIDIFAINTVTAKYFIEKKGYDDLKIALKLDYNYHLKIATHKGVPAEAISILDKTLDSITDEELNKIFNKWTEVTIETQTDWTLLLQVTSLLFVVITFLLWNNRKLNQMVQKRTTELTNRNHELSKALEEIKTLRGIIPICSYCHKIRDDEGSWSQLESYISHHSNAEFSHGICPTCLEQARKDAGISSK